MALVVPIEGLATISGCIVVFSAVAGAEPAVMANDLKASHIALLTSGAWAVGLVLILVGTW